MKRLSSVLFLAALLLAKPTGQFTGTWSSDGGVGSGKVNLSLNASGPGELSFTYQDQLIKPKVVSFSVTDDQVDFICQSDLEGLRLKTAFHGTVDGKTISGKYQSSSADDGSLLDSGTWKATQQ